MYLGKFMKIYSYQEDADEFLDLQEISFVAKPEDLSEVVKFFQKAIALQKSGESEEDHIHLQDEWDGWNDSYPDIVIKLK